MPVAESGRLVGVVRREALASADGGDAVASVMEPPRFARADEALDVAIGLRGFFRGSPVPVVDDDDTLIGVITASAVDEADGNGASAP